MEQLNKILQINEINDNMLNSLEESIQLENKLFSFDNEVLTDKNKILYEIISIRRRLVDFSLELINEETLKYYNLELEKIKYELQCGNTEECKLRLVLLTSKLEMPTRFYTTLYSIKKTIYLDKQKSNENDMDNFNFDKRRNKK